MLSIRDAADGLPGFGAFGVRPACADCRMRILLDECVPWPMHKLLASHDCTTTQKRGRGGVKTEN